MLIGLILSGCSSRPPLQTAHNVDLSRYAGRWFEIAKYPNFFQRACVSDTMAEYSPLPDGSIRVVNSCRKKDGTLQRVTGTAEVVPGSGNARLKVGFGGPFKGDYWILDFDRKDYSWALVGHPSRQFLWILARTPEIPQATYDKIVASAVRQGYDAGRIERTRHSQP